MVNLFAKLFIKDYENIESEKVRNSYGVLAGVFGVISNLVLFIIKIIIGIISASVSIIADAINNLSDMGSSILTLVGFKISGKPADKDHPFGHQRIEYVIGLIISMLIIFIGFELFTASIDKILNPSTSKMTIPVLIILVVAIIFKFLQGLFYFSVSKKINSIALKASGKDSFNDVISTSFVLLGAVLSYFINAQGSEVLKDIFNTLMSVFDYAKPYELILNLIKNYIIEDSIILDFFAGSGTTGHAVLDLNKQDGGNRTFILCQLNEKTETTPNGIAYDVTSKRLKRVMTGECYDGTKDFKWIEKNEAYGGNLDVYEIENVANFESTEGKTPFEVIDETLYGKEKFSTVKEKIDWVCSNFEKTQKYLEDVEN